MGQTIGRAGRPVLVNLLYRFWLPAGGKMPWGTASTQKLSGYGRFDSAISARGYLWREGCSAQVLDDLFVGLRWSVGTSGGRGSKGVSKSGGQYGWDRAWTRCSLR